MGPSCRAAAVTTTEDAYVYDEEGTEVETFSPEVTDPVSPGLFDQSTRPSGMVQDINKVDEFGEKTFANSLDLVTEPVTSFMVELERSNGTLETTDSIRNTSKASIKTIETTTTTSKTSANFTVPDTSTKTSESTTTPMASTTAIFSHTSRNTSHLLSAESTTLQPFSSNQINDTFELTTPSQVFTSEMTTASPETPSTVTNSSSLQSTKSENDTLYEEMALEPEPSTTTTTAIYEEGYYDPKKAPTRYGQREEGLTTIQWQFVSDHGIGMRDYNLILYAVNNTAVLEKGSLLNYVYFVFKEILNVNMTLLDIRYCRYLRSRNQEYSKKVPPVLVAFTRMEVKNEILHKRKLLKPTNIKVEHDMPRKMLDEQNALLKPLMDKYRAMGQYVVVRSGKLLVDGKVLTEIYLPEKYTFDPMQTFESYVTTTVKSTTPAIEIPPDLMEFGYGDKKSGKRKKIGKLGGAKKKRKPMIRIPLDEEVGDELSVEVLFTTKKFFW